MARSGDPRLTLSLTIMLELPLVFAPGASGSGDVEEERLRLWGPLSDMGGELGDAANA